MKNTNCYFYDPVPNMNSEIPTCNYYDKLGYCPCENCQIFISRQEVRELVRKYTNSKKPFFVIKRY